MSKTKNNKNDSYEKLLERKPLMDPADFRFDELAFNIYQDMPFLGYILASVKRIRTTEIPTAAIDPNNRLYYNPEFFACLRLMEQKAVLLHEVLHRAHHHFHRADQILQIKFGIKNCMVKNAFDSLDPIQKVKIMRYQKLFNITMDGAINQLIAKKFKLPDGLVDLKYMQEALDAGNIAQEKKSIILEPEREFEYYFEKLYDVASEQLNGPVHVVQFGDPSDQSGEGSGEGSDDVIYEDAADGKDGDEGKSAEEYEQEFKNTLRKAYQKQREYEAKKGIGNGHCDSLCDILPDMSVKVKDKKLWEALINKGFGNHRIPDYETTLKRPSRRIKGNPFGKKRMTGSKHVVVCVDTSGSVSMNEVTSFFGCINRAIRKYNVTVDLLLTTTKVYRAFENVKKLTNEHVKISSGGTDLTTAQKWIMKNKPKGGRGEHMVVLTDGYTDWLSDVPFTTAAIYTKNHTKLKGVDQWAVIEED